MTLIKYSEFRPTQFDVDELSLPHHQDWLVLPVMIHNSSQIVDESNFEEARKRIKACGPKTDEGESPFFIARLGHWTIGSFEIILVEPGSEAHEVAKDIDEELHDYPILNELDYEERKLDAASKDWATSTIAERLHLIEQANEYGDVKTSIMAARRSEVPLPVFWALQDNYI